MAIIAIVKVPKFLSKKLKPSLGEPINLLPRNKTSNQLLQNKMILIALLGTRSALVGVNLSPSLTYMDDFLLGLLVALRSLRVWNNILGSTGFKVFSSSKQ